MAVAGPVFATERSARVLIVLAAVALLLAAPGSAVLLEALAVLARDAPLATFAFTSATIVNVAEAPAPSVAMVSLIALPAWLNEKTGPELWACERNNVPAGKVSASATACA